MKQSDIKRQVEITIEEASTIYPKNKLILILNRKVIQANYQLGINSFCLQLVTKYNQLSWPVLSSIDTNDIVLFIGPRT